MTLRIVRSVVLPALLICASPAASSQTPATGRLGVVDTFLGSLTLQGFSGSVLVHDGVNQLSRCYGLADREASLGCDERTAFDIGSVTKQFTGAAILKLEMQGKLRVTDLLSRHLPGVPADKQSITLHHLLTHSAGLPPQVGGDYEPLTRETFLARVWGTPLRTAPGREYEYSNVGYSLLAATIEIVSGQPYERYLREHLFMPAGMTDTGYRLPDWKPGQVAIGYRGDVRWGAPNSRPWDQHGPYWNLLGNGGLLSTPRDMFRWHTALLEDSILGADAKTKYYARHIEEGAGAGTYYGYGWALFPTPRKTTLVTHNGGNGVFFADVLRYLDEKVTIIFMTNAVRPEFRTVPTEIASTIFRPEYTPRLPVAATQTITSLDAHPHGALLREFIRTITAGDSQGIERFVRERFAPGLRDGAPMDRHLTVLTTVGGRIKGASIASLVVDGVRTQMTFTGLPLRLSIIIENGRIAGLGLE